MKMRNKLLSLVMALAMMLSVASVAFAATADPNFTAGPDTAWSTQAAAGQSVTLTAGPADAYYGYSGFDNAADAAGTVWTFNLNGDKCTYTTGTAQVVDENSQAVSYVSTITITPVAGFYGPISVHAVPANPASSYTYVDLTVYVEAAATQAPVNNVFVEVADVHGDNMYEGGTTMTVAAAAANSANPFYSTNNNSGSAQSYATAGDALYSLMAAGNITFEQAGGYVNAITDSTGTKLEQYMDSQWNYYGWNYCVIRGGSIVEAGNIVSASVLPLQAGDMVYWAFGTAAEAAEYFDELVD